VSGDRAERDSGSDDRVLLDAWRDGDIAAGNELLQRYLPQLIRFYFNKVGDGQVEDLIQRTMMSCVRSRDGFRGDASFRTWVFEIARNELLMHYRKRSSAQAVDPAVDSIADLGPSPSTLARQADDRRLLLQALGRLPADQQMLLELHYWEGLVAAELSLVFDVEPITIRTRLHRAREKLRGVIERLEADPVPRDRALDTLSDPPQPE